MPDPTTNFGWDVPDVGGDNGAWGGVLNTVFDNIDTELNTTNTNVTTVTTTANAALPVAGGTMTGELDILTAKNTRVDLGNISTTATLDFDAANAWTATVTGTVTIALSNVPTGTFMVGGVVKLINGGSSTVTWPAAFEWEGGTAPTLTTSGTDLIAFVTLDAGTSWQATALLDLS